jgi:twinkle protein
MSRIVHRDQPCLDPVCGSSDARQVYEEGTSYCFSCMTWFPPQEEEEIVVSKKANHDNDESVLEVAKYESRGFKERNIRQEVCQFFDVKVGYNAEREIVEHFYPYGVDKITGYKVRKLPKEFRSIGKMEGLFGQSKFNPQKRLVITEGEIDALSVAAAFYNKYTIIYPVVSLPSASGTKALLEQRDWVRQFDEVVLLLDEDEAGRRAQQDCIRIVGIDKVRIAKLPCKDPNEVILKKGFDVLLRCIWDASKYTPAGIVQKDELKDKIAEYRKLVSIPYPDCLGGLNDKVKGMRAGEIALFIAPTGAGKTTVVKEIILHLLSATETDKIGIVSLEEDPAVTSLGFIGMALNKNPAHFPLTDEEVDAGFEKVFASDRIVMLDHQGSINDHSIIDQLEYMCLSGCRYLFVDHITILVSEGAEGLTGNEAMDKVMAELLKLVKRHKVHLCLVSHLRKAPSGAVSFEEGRLPSLDDIKGSGSVKQISFDIIAFARKQFSNNPDEKNRIEMRVLKSRYTGLTGDIAGSDYIKDTGRLMAHVVNTSV